MVSDEEVSREREALGADVEAAAAELLEYRELKHRLSQTLMAASRAADELRSQVREETNAILEEARTKAEEIVGGSRRELDRLQAEVRRLQGLETEMHSGYRAFLLAALELLDKGDDIEWPESEEPVADEPARA